jgi:hypothetical protein
VRSIGLSGIVFSIFLISCAQQAQQLWSKPGSAPDDFNRDRYACLQQSQQPTSSAYLNQYGGVANSNIVTNGGLYGACMNAGGWVLTTVTDVKAFTEAMRPLDDLQQEFCSRSDVQALWQRMACKVRDTTQGQLSNQSKISNEEKAALAKWQDFIREVNDKLAANYVTYYAKNGQAVASAIQAGAVEVNKLAVELSSGRIAWGEFNRRRVEISKRRDESVKAALTY